MSFDIILDRYLGGGRSCFAPSIVDRRGTEHKEKFCCCGCFLGAEGVCEAPRVCFLCGKSPRSLRVRISCKQVKDDFLYCSTGIGWPVGRVASGRWWRMSSITIFSVPAPFTEQLHWDVHLRFQEVLCKFTHSCCMDENFSEKVEILLPWCFFRICVRAFWF